MHLLGDIKDLDVLKEWMVELSSVLVVSFLNWNIRSVLKSTENESNQSRVDTFIYELYCNARIIKFNR